MRTRLQGHIVLLVKNMLVLLINLMYKWEEVRDPLMQRNSEQKEEKASTGKSRERTNGVISVLFEGLFLTTLKELLRRGDSKFGREPREYSFLACLFCWC